MQSAHAATRAAAVRAPVLTLLLAGLIFITAIGTAFARDARDVRVRYGKHDGYVRIVFDWRESTPYELELQPNGAIVRFAADNSFDLKRIKGRKRVAVSQVGPGAADVSYARARSVRHFLADDHVVIDLLESLSGEALPTKQAVAEKPVKAIEPPKQKMAAMAPKPVQIATATDAPVMELGSPAETHPKAQTTVPSPEEGLESVEVAPSAPDIASIIPNELAGVQAQPETPGPDRLKLAAKDTGTAITLDLPAGSVPAAAFSRAQAHWILLDAPYAVDLAAAEIIGLDIVQLPFIDKTVLHMRSGSKKRLAAAKTAKGWRFMLGDAPETDIPAAPVRRTFEAPSGPRIFVDDLQDARLLRVSDPEVGDALFVTAVVSPLRIVDGFVAPDMALLPTALGVVLAPKVEGVGARLRLGALEVRRKGGLRMSQPEPIVEKPQIQVSRIPPSEWRGENPDYFDAQRKLTAEVNGVPPIARKPTRLKLAQFYLAHGRAAEAIGMIEFTAGGAENVKDSLDFLAMRGIAGVMLGQHDLAAKDLSSDAYNGDAQVEVWRAAGMSAAGEHRFAAAKFRQFWRAAGLWPLKQQVQLASAAGGSALSAGLPQLAKEFAQGLSVSTSSARDAAALTLILAGVHEANGQDDKAVSAYKTAIRDGDLEVQAKGELGLIKHEVARGTLDPDAAASRLTGLQMRWRGDRTEYENLKTLGELRLASSQYRQGFEALSEAARTFARRFDTTDVVASMAAGFERAFVEGGADELPPLDAVALYRDFEDLAPPGHKGDLALAALSRRLRALDLLDEADEILDHLVRRRLDGAILADLGGELADLRLMRREWARALSALDESERGEMEASAEIRDRRIDLRARALAGSGNPKEALALLNNATTLERLHLKAKFAWRSGNWVAARDAYRGLSEQGAFAEDGKDEAALEAQAALSVRWAVSAAMLGAEDELAMIGQRFEGKAKDPKLASALAMLTTPMRPRGEAIAAARAAIAGLDTVTKNIGAYQAAQRKSDTSAKSG